MREISGLNQLPKINLRVESVFVDNRLKDENIVHIIKENMRHQLAEKMLEDTRLFSVETKDGYTTVKASIYVLTEDEYLEMLRRRFKEGIEHAQGFMPLCYDGSKL